MRIYGVTGWKDTGKTTMMERLVTEITARGLSVSTVKHAHHNVDVDQPGKDSYRHRQAGAQQVILSSANRWALMNEIRDGAEAPLDGLLTKLSPVDLVLVEGYKRDRHPKLEVAIRAHDRGLIAANDPTIRAIATGYDLSHGSLPVFNIDEIGKIADFILREVGIDQSTQARQ